MNTVCCSVKTSFFTSVNQVFLNKQKSTSSFKQYINQSAYCCICTGNLKYPMPNSHFNTS